MKNLWKKLTKRNTPTPTPAEPMPTVPSYTPNRARKRSYMRQWAAATTMQDAMKITVETWSNPYSTTPEVIPVEVPE